MNLLKDDVFTIKLPGNDLILTRYLYIKDEVRIALLVSLLNKSETALYWAYELYYSGFVCELVELIWKIYYDFYATLNPEFEERLTELFNRTISNTECIVATVIYELLTKDFNNDIFNIRNICEQFEPDVEYSHTSSKVTNINELIDNIKFWIDTQDIRSFSQWCFNVNKIFTFKEISNLIKLTNKNKNKNKWITGLHANTSEKIILIIQFVSLFEYKSCNNSDIFEFEIEFDEIACYLNPTNIRPRDILKKCAINNIDEFQHLCLFKLTRYNYDFVSLYRNNWEYQASFSPLWLKRIKQCKGRQDFILKKIAFNCDNDLDTFHELFGLEPDEQPLLVQQKSTQTITTNYDWKWFHLTYKKNGIFIIYDEELDEFTADKLTY